MPKERKEVHDFNPVFDRYRYVDEIPGYEPKEAKTTYTDEQLLFIKDFVDLGIKPKEIKPKFYARFPDCGRSWNGLGMMITKVKHKRIKIPTHGEA